MEIEERVDFEERANCLITSAFNDTSIYNNVYKDLHVQFMPNDESLACQRGRKVIEENSDSNSAVLLVSNSYVSEVTLRSL